MTSKYFCILEGLENHLAVKFEQELREAGGDRLNKIFDLWLSTDIDKNTPLDNDEYLIGLIGEVLDFLQNDGHIQANFD